MLKALVEAMYKIEPYFIFPMKFRTCKDFQFFSILQ